MAMTNTRFLLYEFKADLNKYLMARGGKNNTLEKLIEFNEQNAAKSMPYFKQEIFEKAQAKENLNDSGYKLALLTSKTLTQDKGIDAVMDKHKLDALVAPSNSQSWLIDLIMGDSPTQYGRKLKPRSGFGLSKHHRSIGLPK